MSSPYPKGDVAVLIRTLAPDGSTAIDVGAGLSPATLSAFLDRGCVVTVIEPDARCREHIPAGVTVIPAAAADQIGTATLHMVDVADRSTLYAAIANEETVVQRVTVPTVTLDSLGIEAQIVKLDAQGAEPAILRGATRLLQTCPTWIVEAWPEGLMKAGSTPVELLTLLTDAGLTVTWPHTEVPVTLAQCQPWVGPRFSNWIARR